MKLLLSALALFSVVPPLWSEGAMPKAKLAGESVYARIGNQAVAVAAAFEFADWAANGEKLVYFPIFAPASADPLQVLDEAQLEFDLNGKPGGVATPCAAPMKLSSALPGIRIFWYSASLADMVDGEAEEPADARFIVRLSYSQPLLGRRFYYLPVLMGQAPSGQEGWKYQMVVRSVTKPVRVISKGTEYRVLLDAVAVQLRDREIVVIE
ncbi:MAG: hypothetical protein K9M98_10665 [Cephaloticoccus sp.]|nr:hypothetical protein [Cephaloticoccus sp.]MCF7760953.1 hypothetical protein [Cephaloticoccus sp.]